MDKSKKYYWAVFQDREMLFEGSFTECWKHLVDNYANATLKSLHKQGIRIARQS